MSTVTDLRVKDITDEEFNKKDPYHKRITKGNVTTYTPKDFLQLPVENKESILQEAQRITDGVKQTEYGESKDNFENIANLWSSYLENKGIELNITSEDVALMMILFKVSRQQSGNKRDNFVDIAGYAREGAKIQGLD